MKDRVVLGLIDCPVCRTGGQELREATTKRAYMNCDQCDCQVFARSKFSDAKLRALVPPKPAPATTTTAKQDPPTDAKPAPKKQPATKQPAAPEPAVRPASAAAGAGFFRRG